MTDCIIKTALKRSPNPTLALARQVAEARLRRSGFVALKTLKRRGQDSLTAPLERRFPQTLVEKLAGGY